MSRLRRLVGLLLWELALLHLWQTLVLLARAFAAYRTASDPEPALKALRDLDPST